MTFEQEQKLIELKAAGATGRNIGEEIGLHPSNVSRNANRPDIKARIEALQERVINEATDQAADNIIHAVSQYRQIPARGGKADAQLREHGYRASMEILRGIGILPSHMQSIYIGQIINGSQTVMSPVLFRVLEAMSSQWAGTPEEIVAAQMENVDDE